MKIAATIVLAAPKAFTIARESIARPSVSSAFNRLGAKREINSAPTNNTI